MKRVIWGNMNLDVNDWRNDYKEWLEINEIDDREPDDEDDIYDWMVATNANYLYDERMNLNIPTDGRILVIADLGLWNGRKTGYKILNGNISSILYDYDNAEYVEWYSDGHNIRATAHHHDGTNYYLYREIREDRNIQNLLNAIYNGEEISRGKLNYYTKSINQYVKETYGW